MTAVRRPAAASTLYPASAVELEGIVDILLSDAVQARDKLHLAPRAVIAPHASYAYSGIVMASAYARLRGGKTGLERVVLLGPSHYRALEGLATSSAEFFTTPTGELTVDRGAVQAIESLPNVKEDDAAHLPEHSLEVHLPFVLATLGRIPIVPVLVGGGAKDADVERVLRALWDDRTLVVVSSDLSHSLAYDAARSRDDATTHAIETLDAAQVGDEDACARAAVRGLLRAAKQRGLGVETLDRRSSGDAGGSRAEVVGYGAYALS